MLLPLGILTPSHYQVVEPNALGSRSGMVLPEVTSFPGCFSYGLGSNPDTAFAALTFTPLAILPTFKLSNAEPLLAKLLLESKKRAWKSPPLP